MHKELKNIVMAAIFLGMFISGVSIVSAESGERLNFVIFLTDDQRWDTVGDSGVNAEIEQEYGRPIMPEVEKRLVDKGVLFTNAFVTTPLCCPDRASLLSGGFYAHHTGVLNNSFPNGGAKKFEDADTLATRLQAAGYRTALIGKYLNQYPDIAPYIPPGWTKFFATWTDKRGVEGDQRWFYPCAAIGSSDTSPGGSIGSIKNYRNRYVTYLQRDEALSFLDEVGDSPFFLYFSTHAPHGPATPAPNDPATPTIIEKDGREFPRYRYRGRSYKEEDLSDKPEWVRQEARKYRTAEADEFHLKQLRSLQAVDRAIGQIMDKIEKMGRLDKTVFIFAGDNGYLWGEHWLRTKAKPYEESIRVPFVVRMPGMRMPRMCEEEIKGRKDGHLITVNLDIGATIFELAGIKKETDGTSLVSLLSDESSPFERSDFLIENFGNADKSNWAGLRTDQFKYVEYANEKQEKELYDLENDTYEKESKHNDGDYQGILGELSERLASQKALTMTVYEAPKVKVGKPYEFQLKAWGGVKPYTWSITEGPDGKREELPDGLSLDGSTGLISGIPSSAKKRTVWIKVEDSRIVQPAGEPQSFSGKFVFER